MAYVLRRLLEMVPVLLIVVAATFFLAHAVPGGPFDKDRPLPAEVKARLEKYYGLDQPLPIQLGNYVVNLAQGDLGPSIKYPGWSVREVIGSRIGVSASLGLVSLLLAVPDPRFDLLAGLGLAAALRLGFGYPLRAARLYARAHHRRAARAIDARIIDGSALAGLRAHCARQGRAAPARLVRARATERAPAGRHLPRPCCRRPSLGLLRD